jgi:hypothetical protein
LEEWSLQHRDAGAEHPVSEHSSEPQEVSVMLKLKVRGKTYKIHQSPYVEGRIEGCEKAVQSVMQYAAAEKEKTQTGPKTDYSNGMFYAYRNILQKFDDMGYYTDL